MNIQDFNENALEPLFAECRNLLNTKGADYSGKEDRFLNFKANGERLGMTKYQIWSVYFAKHIDAIFNAIKANPNEPKTNSEAIETRVQDAICYLSLMYGMMLEDKLPRIAAEWRQEVDDAISLQYYSVEDMTARLKEIASHFGYEADVTVSIPKQDEKPEPVPEDVV